MEESFSESHFVSQVVVSAWLISSSQQNSLENAGTDKTIIHIVRGVFKRDFLKSLGFCPNRLDPRNCKLYMLKYFHIDWVCGWVEEQLLIYFLWDLLLLFTKDWKFSNSSRFCFLIVYVLILFSEAPSWYCLFIMFCLLHLFVCFVKFITFVCVVLVSTFVCLFVFHHLYSHW